MNITKENAKTYTDALWRAAEAAGFATAGEYSAQMARDNSGPLKFAFLQPSKGGSEIAIVLPKGQSDYRGEFKQPKSLSVRMYRFGAYKINSPDEATKVELPDGFFLPENSAKFNALVEALKAAVAELRPKMEAYDAARQKSAAAAAERKRKEGRFNDIIRAEMGLPLLEVKAFTTNGEIGGFQHQVLYSGEADKLIELARAIKAKADELGVKIATGY